LPLAGVDAASQEAVCASSSDVETMEPTNA
jgi:hypothetical protein